VGLGGFLWWFVVTGSLLAGVSPTFVSVAGGGDGAAVVFVLFDWIFAALQRRF
jgi:hypothetical protein